ncbi:MAG: ADP-ribosylglycohydrolase family protein [Patescibacteria group bacterium]
MTAVTQDRFRGAMLGMAIGERAGTIAQGIKVETTAPATATALHICRRIREFRRCDPLDIELAILVELSANGSVPFECEGSAAAAIAPVALWYAATNSMATGDIEYIGSTLGDDDGDFRIGSRAALVAAIYAIMLQAGGSPKSFHLLYDLCGVARRFENRQTAGHPPAPEESAAALLSRAMEAAEKSGESIGRLVGTGGHAVQTVPLTLAICAIHDFGDFQNAIVDAVKVDGAKAARGALAGALIGARVGLAGIPRNSVRASPDRKIILAAADELYALAGEVVGGTRVNGVTARDSRSDN